MVISLPRSLGSQVFGKRDFCWRSMINDFDSKDDYRTGYRNVSHCQQQQSYSGLRSPGRSYSTYLFRT